MEISLLSTSFFSQCSNSIQNVCIIALLKKPTTNRQNVLIMCTV